jgi:hypothetical protein
VLVRLDQLVQLVLLDHPELLGHPDQSEQLDLLELLA